MKGIKVAVSITRYQLRPPEVEAVTYSRTSEAAEIAAWMGGVVREDGALVLRDTYGDTVVPLGAVVMRHRDGTIEVRSLLALEAEYTRKLV